MVWNGAVGAAILFALIAAFAAVSARQTHRKITRLKEHLKQTGGTR